VELVNYKIGFEGAEKLFYSRKNQLDEAFEHLKESMS